MVDFGKRPGDMMKEDYDTDDSGVVDDVEALPDHADDHEDTGDDELSVSGLSGELADAQPVKAHLLGSASHAADSLVNLNLKISDANLDDSGDARTPAAHAASHQNGGTDEPTVAGLSGELADNQPPKAHDLAGAAHNADTLADLNLKLSDATLDDSAATRTPSAHAASHEDDGTDEIDCTGLVGAGGADPSSVWVDSGDKASADVQIGTLTTNGTWQALDLSTPVPVGAAFICLRVSMRQEVAGSALRFRLNGNSNDYNVQQDFCAIADAYCNWNPIVACDANRVIQYKADNLTWHTIDIVVTGWII